MRVIAGKARRLVLKTPKGDSTRPTTDRIKETLFNILQPSLYGCRFLDLFAGSGGIGIEAVSRGAMESVFVENNRDAIKCIKENIEHTKLDTQCKLIEGDVFYAIKKLSGEGAFDIIFMDPPYDEDYYERVLESLSESDIIDCDTVIICEAGEDKDFSFAVNLGFDIAREKVYKSNKHVFLYYENAGGKHA